MIAWHDLSNAEFHCWPFGADDENPESFPVCVGKVVNTILMLVRRCWKNYTSFSCLHSEIIVEKESDMKHFCNIIRML